MNALRSIIDVGLVARFELIRAIRTWRALAMMLLYGIATVGGALIFVGLIFALEQTIASALGVPQTNRPGAMMAELITDDSFRSVVEAMVGKASVDNVITQPPLAIFYHWFGFRLVPFLAAVTAAEAVAIDMGTRALRFEALRTGRLELVLGRLVGQVFLAGIAIFASIIGVWAVGMLAMVGNDPLLLASSLGRYGFHVWAVSLPFLGLGIACSQLTASAIWARVLALLLTTLTWVALFTAQYIQTTEWPIVGDIMLQFLPQTWLPSLWRSGWQPWLGMGGLVCWGIAITAIGYAAFHRRKL